MGIRAFLDLVEIRTKVVSVSTLLLATLFARSNGHSIPAGLLFLLAAASLLLDMGTTAANSLMDYLRGVDRVGVNRERDKVLVLGGMDPTDALIVIVILFFLTTLLGLILAVLTSLRLIPMGIACVMIGIAYSVGPLPLSSTPVGELFAGGTLGSGLFLITCIVLTGDLGSDALLASLPSTLFIASILTANNTCDIEGDRAAGRRTLSIIIGRRAGSILVYLLGTGALVLAVVLAWIEVLPSPVGYASAGAAPVLFVIYFSIERTGFSHETKSRIMGRVSLGFILFTAAIATGLLW